MRSVLLAACAAVSIASPAVAAQQTTYGVAVSMVENTITSCQQLSDSLAGDVAAAKKKIPDVDIVLFGGTGEVVTDIRHAHSAAVRKLGASGDPVAVVFFADDPAHCGAIRLGIIKSQGVEPTGSAE